MKKRVAKNRSPHKYAGKTVKLRRVKSLGPLKGKKFDVKDWYDNINPDGEPWIVKMVYNPTCRYYAQRTLGNKKLVDENVVYGKIEGLGYLVHDSELGEVVKENG